MDTIVRFSAILHKDKQLSLFSVCFPVPKTLSAIEFTLKRIDSHLKSNFFPLRVESYWQGQQ